MIKNRNRKPCTGSISRNPLVSHLPPALKRFHSCWHFFITYFGESKSEDLQCIQLRFGTKGRSDNFCYRAEGPCYHIKSNGIKNFCSVVNAMRLGRSTAHFICFSTICFLEVLTLIRKFPV